MRKWFLLLTAVLTLGQASAQTLIYHENFESPSNADSVTSSGASPWAINSRIAAQGLQCDSNYVVASDSSFLVTTSFNCSGYSNILLSFSHICKIELMDGGEVFVSVNMGPWVKLSAAHYLDPGNSQFISQGSKFSSNSYPLDWFPVQNTLKPTNTWWKTENFNISAIAANQTNVRIRFKLKDGTNNGSGGAHGWYIDNIRVIGANSELIPPVITLNAPIWQDTVNVTGPFDVLAHIRDASGIDTVWLSYKVNGGAEQYIPMLWVSDSTYKGVIPSYTWNTSITYYVHAEDNSPAHNSTNSSSISFFIKQGPDIVTIGSGTVLSTYPYYTYYHDAKSQMIYLASEIITAGGSPGLIPSIAFNVSNIGGPAMQNFTIQMQNTSLTALTGFVNTGWTTVFNGTYTVTGTGWQTIELQTPFNWNGTSNLLINICFDNTSFSTTSSVFSTANAGKTWGQALDASAGCAFNAGAAQANRPNIRLATPHKMTGEDAGISQILEPTGVALANVNIPLKVTLRNFADDTLESVTIKYTLDSIPQPDFLWTGSLLAGVASTPLTIGTLNLIEGPHTLKVWTVNPNDSTDENFANDTSQIAFYACDAILNGTYTIGATGDFPDFASVLNTLLNCGVNGPVIFNVQDGVYNERISLTDIPGSSAVNTVTFQSQSGDYSDVIITSLGTGTSDNYVLRLNGGDNLIFRNMTLQSQGSTYTTVLAVGNNSIRNTFENIYFLGVNTTSSTSTNNAVIYSASGATSNDSINTFQNCRIENGSYGMYWYGNSTTILERKTVIRGNTFLNQYYRGIQLYNQDAPLVESNLITTNTLYSTFYGLYTYYCNNNFRLLRNTITIPNGGYGLYSSTNSGSLGNEGLVANNMISIGGTGSAYGIYATGTNSHKYYFNSVSLTNTGTTAYAFYQGTGSNLRLANNVLSYWGSSSSGYTIYAGSTTVITYSDYNDLFSTGPNIGYWNSAARANLTAWRTASLLDSNSVALDPEFISPTNLHSFSPNINNKGKYFPEVSIDIDGQARSMTTPDIGADEFNLLTEDAKMLSVLLPQNSCGFTALEDIRIRIKNTGLNPLTNISAYYVINNGTPVQELIAGPIPPGDTLNYTFLTKADLSAYGYYNLTVYVKNPLDGNELNDSIRNYRFYSGYDFLTSGPYTQSFEATEYFADWSSLSINGDNFKWEIPFNGIPKTGSKSARFFNGTTNTGGDWMFSRCFPMQAGETYEISYWYRGASTSTPSKLKLKYGQSPNPAGMTMLLDSLPNILSTTYQKSTKLFVAPATGIYYFGWYAFSDPSSSNHMYVDDINIKYYPPQEVTALNISAPVDGCGLSSNEQVVIQIYNSGSDTINGNLTAYYSINGNPPISQTVPGMILPADTLDFTFTATADLSVTTTDSIFNIIAWVKLTADPIPGNDTTFSEVISGHIPLVPTVTNDTVIQNYSALLHAINPFDSVYWYVDNITTTYFHSGQHYLTPALTDTITYYVQSGTSGGAVESAGIINGGASSFITTAAGWGLFFTATENIYLDYVHVYPTGTGTITINITDLSNNILQSSAPFALTGTGVEKIQVPVDLVVPAGNYKIGMSYTGITNLIRESSGVSYPYSTPSGNLVITSGANGGSSSTSTSYYWFYDWGVKPVGSGCTSARVPVTAYVIYPAEDLAMVEILSPADGCTDGEETVSVRLFNNGIDTLENSFSLSYLVSGNPVPVTEVVSTDLLPGDSLTYTFATPAIMPVLSGDSTYQITVYGVNAGDIFFGNDTIIKPVTLSYTPADPIVTHDTVLFGNSATLQASSPASLYWYNVPTGGSYIDTGSVYNTPVLFDTATYYVQASTSTPGIVKIVGTGTTTTSYIPFYYNFDFSWTATLHTPDEMQFQGMIDTIAYYVNAAPSPAYTQIDQRIYMSLTGGTTFANGDYPGTAGMTQVFQGTLNLNAAGWLKIPLQTPFYYDGTSALQILYENYDGDYLSNETTSFRTTATTGNKAKYKYQDNTFPAVAGTLTTSRPNVYFSYSELGCSSNRIPVTAYVIIPEEDIALTQLLSPVDGCTFGTENVTIEFFNGGVDTIENPFTLSYEVQGNPTPVTEIVNYIMLPGDTVVHTFATPMSAPLLSGDSTFYLTVYGNNAGDIYFLNDTLWQEVTLAFSPPDPVVAHDTVPYATQAMLNASSSYPLQWYSVPSGGSMIDTGSVFTTPVLFGDQTYYVQAIDGSGESAVGPYDNTFGTGGAVDYTTYFLIFDVLDPMGANIKSVDMFPGVAAGSAYTIVLQDAGLTTLATYSGTTTVGSGMRETVPVNFSVPYGSGFRIGFTTMPLVYRNTAGASFPYTIPGVISITGHTFSGYPEYYYYFYNWIVGTGSGCPSHRIPVHAVVTGQPDNDAAIIEIVAPADTIPLGIANVDVLLKNYGLDTMTSVQIGWSVNGVVQTPFNWSGSLATGETEVVNIGTYDFVYTPYPGLNEIVAWSKNPNGVNDLTVINDTASKWVDAHDPLNGIYYIGTATPDFDDFSEAVMVLGAWGVDGPVTILTESGTYNEQISIPAVNGASAVNTITFASLTGVNTDVTLQYAAAGTADNFVVKLNGADYIAFEDMTIKSTAAATYGRVVELVNGANFNRFEGNILQSIVTTSSSSSVIYSTSTASDNSNRFIGNDILNGYYGVYLYGSSTNRKQGNVFEDNNFEGFYYYGMYLYYNDSLKVIGNRFRNGANAGTNYGIYSYYGHNGCRYESNDISGNGNGSFYGISLLSSSSTNAATASKIINNFISNTTSTGTAYGIYLSTSSYTDVYYNSVNIGGGSNTAGRAMYVTGGTAGINVVNNNLANTSWGYAYYVGTAAAIGTSNYNNFYTNGSVLAYWSADRATLAALQTASSKDANSRSAHPGFYSPVDLHTYGIDLYNAGTPLASVSVDIDGESRSLTTPCIGADEFTPPPVDAGVISIDAPVSPVPGGVQQVRVSIRNFGLDPLTSATIRFEVDGVPGTPFAWTGSLASGIIEPNILIGTYSFPAGASVIKAWTELPNGVTDPNHNNDTSETTIIGCNGPLAGNYTIGGSGADFNDFTEAVLTLSYCGVSAPVVFNVAAGNYDEQISIPAIVGASSASTITFQSASGVSTDVVLRYAALGTNDNYVVQLDSADYIRFRNMTLQSTTASTYGKVVVMRGGASFNTFEGNIIRSVSSTSSNAAAVYCAAGAQDDFNVFTGNTIENGYYGIYCYGSSTYKKQGNQFLNNVISGYYYYGLYNYYSDSTIVVGNTLTNASNSGTTYHLYLGYSDNGLRVERNRVHATNTSTCYALYSYYSDGSATKPNMIFNNFISQGTGTSTAYGLYSSNSTYTNFYYNSVNITAGSSSNRALYVTGGNNVNVINNNLVTIGGGHAYYVSTTTALVTSDYNNIYTPTGLYAYYGSTAYATLAALQAASGKDSNSIAIDPNYVSASDLHVLNPGLNGTGTPIAGITTDIDGQTRNAQHPDIGADEFSPIAKDIAVTAFTSPANMFASAGSSIVVNVSVRNLGSDTITSFNTYYQYGVSSPVMQAWTGTLLPSQTTTVLFSAPFTAQSGSVSLCAYTALPGDGNLSNDTLCNSFTGVPVLMVPDSTDFESSNYFYGVGSQGLWEYGTPASVTINSAHSPVNAWKTNLDGYYTANAIEYLYSPYYNFTQVADATLKFWHWFQTETNVDGGKIEYSIGGSTFVTLGYYNDPAGTNWYNTTVGGQVSWSGNSGGWVLSEYDLSTIPAIVNATAPVQFRYRFTSNGTNSNYDGWAVDDFAITAPPLAKDAGVIAIVNPAGSSVTGSNVTLEVTLQNFGTDSLMSIPVAYRINGGTITQATWTGVLMPGATTNYTFPTTFVSPGTDYTLCAFTKRSGDIYKYNDTTCALIDATAASLDAGVIALLSPGTQTPAGDSVEVIVRIQNFGTSTLTSIPLGYSRNGVQLYTTTWTGNLATGATVDFTFPQKYVSPLANYSLCAYSMLPGDANAANDQHCVYPEGVTGIDEYGMNGFFLLQNIPNPAREQTTINFVVPEAGNALLEVRNLMGQVMLTEQVDAVSGLNSFILNTASMASGVYYYSVTFDEQRLTRKMVVN